MKGEVEGQAFGFKKKLGKSPVDVLIDQYIDAATVITESKNVQEYLTGKPDFFQSAIQSSTKIASSIIDRAWELE